MEPPPAEAPRLVPVERLRLRRPRTAKLLAALAALLGVIALQGVALVPMTALGVLMAGLAAWFAVGRTVDGALRVDARGVTLGEGARALRFERGDIDAVLAIPGAAPRAQARLRDGSVIEARVGSLEAADGVLDALGLDARRRALRFPARSPVKQVLGSLGGVALGGYIGFYLGLLLSIGWQHGGRAMLLALPFAAVFAAFGWVSARPIELRVGTDGITLRGAFKTRFVPFSELSGVGENGGDPMLYYRDGHTEVIWNSAVSKQRDLLAALQHRVNGTLASNAEHEALVARGAILERRGRPVAQWRAEVARVVEPGKGYRDAQLTAHDAEALLADARTPVEQRIAAAMALRSLDPEGVATRVRVAADGCASPEMRQALERAGDGSLDEATLARAVAAVERGRAWT